MSWKFVKPMSITHRLLLIFILSTVLMLSVLTGLIYPPLRELLQQSQINHELSSHLLTQICIKKLFVGIWLSALILFAACYLLTKKSLQPIACFTKKLASINASSLDKRFHNDGHPKELRQLAATCNEMLFRIESAFLHIKQFSASMAHELRNPVHYLQTATEITLAKPQSVEAYQHLLQTHLEEYQNLNKLIDNLLFLTRSERGMLQLKHNILSANDLIQSIVDYFQFCAEEKKIEVQVLGDAQIEVDELLFKRVIANILDNSLSYTNQGGKVIITIEKNHHTQIKISDNGIGIEKEHLPLLCQGFYRVNHQTEQKNTGVGLGLAIAKSIMENHRGSLDITSKAHVGTTVTLTLSKIEQAI